MIFLTKNSTPLSLICALVQQEFCSLLFESPSTADVFVLRRLDRTSPQKDTCFTMTIYRLFYLQMQDKSDQP